MKRVHFRLAFGRAARGLGRANTRCGSRGSIELALLGTIAVAIALLYVLGPRSDSQKHDAKRLNLSLSAQNLVQNLESLLLDTDAWNAMVSNSAPAACNPALRCVNTSQSCQGLKTGGGGTPGPTETGEWPINCIHGSNGAVIYNESIPTNGFDESGAPCNEYTANNSRTCPYRPLVRFQVLGCVVGNCTSKPLRLIVRLQRSTHSEIPFNPERYELIMNR